MLNDERRQSVSPRATGKELVSIAAMPFARKVADEYETLETSHRNGLYEFFGRGLTSYKKFLKDADGREELLQHDIISGLREKPDVMKTSRLVLYLLTGARTEPQRNIAGRYARVVDHLHEHRVEDAKAADYVRNNGGMEGVLAIARGNEAPKVSGKASDEMLQGEGEELGPSQESSELQLSHSGSDTRREKLFDRKTDLSIRLKEDAIARVLGDEIPINEVFYLECKKTGAVGRGVRIVGRLVDRPSE